MLNVNKIPLISLTNLFPLALCLFFRDTRYQNYHRYCVMIHHQQLRQITIIQYRGKGLGLGEGCLQI